MIISRTPYRVSFLGGGTDYPDWYLHHGGAVLGTAINKFCYLTVRYLPPFFAHKHRIVYSRIENVVDISTIKHPAVRSIFSELNVDQGIELHHDGDLPARSGLGSSSAFTVGLLNAIYALEGHRRSKRQLSEEAIRIEQDVIGEHVGSQDQIFAAFGGINRIDFKTDGSFDVTPLVLTSERRRQLESHIILIFTGLTRQASTIAKKKIKNFSNREHQLRQLHTMVDEGEKILTSENGSIKEFGQLLHAAWQYKRELAEGVTISSVDEIYDTAMSAGAFGGKLLGAGGGGFIALVVPPSRQAAVSEQLKKLVRVSIEIAAEGSKIVVYEPYHS